MTAGPVVGIPRGLSYTQLNPVWEQFFGALGVRTLVSPPTSRAILEYGLRVSVSEACLPLKACLGHIASLIDKVDLLLVPRCVSLYRREYICPKFAGLPDVVRASFGRLPPLLVPEINLHNARRVPPIDTVAELLGADPARVRRAFMQALRGIVRGSRGPGGPLIAPGADPARTVVVISHPYLIHDRFLTMGLLDRLTAMGVRLVPLDALDAARLRAAVVAPKPLFWSWGTEALGCACALARYGGADGVLFVTSFGCGVDSFVEYMAERRIRAAGIPYALITLDEHTAQAGLITRLEAFVDTLPDRRTHDRNISAHGQCLYPDEGASR